MVQKEIIKHMKDGAQLNVWIDGVKYKGTLTIKNDGVIPEVLATLSDKQISSLLKYDYIIRVGTTSNEYTGHFIQFYKIKEV